MKIILNGKEIDLFQFQEEIAQKIAKDILHTDRVNIHIPTGYGKVIILQRVVDIISRQKPKKE